MRPTTPVRSQNRIRSAERHWLRRAGYKCGSAGTERADGGHGFPQTPAETVRTDSGHSVLGVASLGEDCAARYTSPVIPTMAITERITIAGRFYAPSRQEYRRGSTTSRRWVGRQGVWRTISGWVRRSDSGRSAIALGGSHDRDQNTGARGTRDHSDPGCSRRAPGAPGVPRGQHASRSISHRKT